MLYKSYGVSNYHFNTFVYVFSALTHDIITGLIAVFFLIQIINRYRQLRH